MVQNIRVSGYQVIRLLLCLFVSLSVLGLSSFAEVPRFYGEEVVVTALRIPRLKSTIPWNTKVITRKEIEESSAVKLGDIIRSIPGVSVKANGGLSSQHTASFRGSSAQQVLVLLNGNRINSPTLGLFNLGDLLLTDVERIEVVKAPLSALYGADAVGGVINIVTQKASEKAEYKVSASYGEFSTYDLSLSGSGPHYFFSAATLGSNGFSANNDYKAQDFNIRLSSNMGKAYIEAGAKRYDADKGIAGATSQARQTDKNIFYDIQYRADEIGLKATLSQSDLDMNYEGPWSTSNHKTLSTLFDVQETFDWGPSHAFVLGLETRQDNSESTDSGVHELGNKAVYLQDMIKLPGAANIVLGARQDINSVYGNHLNPRIGCVLNPAQDILLKVSWGSSFRAPTMNDLYWTSDSYFTSNGIGTTEGNPNLKPETAQSLDLTLERTFDEQTSARLTYFSSSINDMIQWANISTSTVDEYWIPSNVASANIQGAEFEYAKSLPGILDGFLNFTYQSAKDKNTDKFLTYRPQTQINVGLKHQSEEWVNSNLLIKNVGERYSDSANTNKLSGYTVVDLSFFRNIGEWEVKLDVDNVFNENYEESSGYSMPGRRYKIGASCTL
jgi:outer membrane cobalamin receptor